MFSSQWNGIFGEDERADSIIIDFRENNPCMIGFSKGSMVFLIWLGNVQTVLGELEWKV